MPRVWKQNVVVKEYSWRVQYVEETVEETVEEYNRKYNAGPDRDYSQTGSQ